MGVHREPERAAGIRSLVRGRRIASDRSGRCHGRGCRRLPDRRDLEYTCRCGDLTNFVSDLRSGRFTEGRAVNDFVLLLQEVHRRGGNVPVPLPDGAKAAQAVRHGSPDHPVTDIIGTATGELGLSLFYIPSMRNGAETSKTAATRFSRRCRSTTTRESSCRSNASGGSRWRPPSTRKSTRLLRSASRVSPPVELGRHRLDFLGVRPRPSGAGAGESADRAADCRGWRLQHVVRQLGPSLSRAGPVLKRPGDHRPTFWLLRLDQFFVCLPHDWQVTVRRADHRYGSDHYPLIARISRCPV